MAAIIARMALANRERKKRKAAIGYRVIGPDKCVYKLQPFDQCYDPQKHNKYIRCKMQIEQRNLLINTAKCKYIYP